MENRKELDYKLITDLDGAKPAMERILYLTNQKIKLQERAINCETIGNNKLANTLRHEISLIKSELAVIRESIEYVRIKMFIQVAKSYLTKEQMIEIHTKADEILASPELYLLK